LNFFRVKIELLNAGLAVHIARGYIA
jgi:hypothetical protein